MGAAGLQAGWFEVVLDRALAQDDGRGLYQPVKDNIPTLLEVWRTPLCYLASHFSAHAKTVARKPSSLWPILQAKVIPSILPRLSPQCVVRPVSFFAAIPVAGGQNIAGSRREGEKPQPTGFVRFGGPQLPGLNVLVHRF